MKLSNQERWIRAMSKIPYSLIGYKGYTEEDARLVSGLYRKYAPKRVANARVRALENELKELPVAPLVEPSVLKQPLPHSGVIENKVPLQIKKTGLQRKPEPKREDYPEPWCRVTNIQGEFVRYEDAKGNPIPSAVAMK